VDETAARSALARSPPKKRRVSWLDRWPVNDQDRLQVFRFTPSMGGGVFQNRTLFKGSFELFRYQTDGKKIEFDLPETHERTKTPFRIERVVGPAPFDLRLVLENSPRGPNVYYGRTDEKATDYGGLGLSVASGADSRRRDAGSPTRGNVSIPGQAENVDS
jgi:hypothetical protein